MDTLFGAFSGNASLLDPDGLAANRVGEITEAQQKRLNFTVGWGQGCSVFFVLGMLLFMGIVFSSVFSSAGSGFNSPIPWLIFGVILLAVVAAFAPRIWKLVDNGIKLKRDRDNRAIRQTQGQISFDKNGYLFQTNERSLALPSSANTGGLLPGATYRVFYLDETGFILSAEELYPAGPAQVQAAMREILARANNFSLEDLEHNRNGEITSSQRMKPLGQVIGGGVFGLFALVFGVLFFLPTYLSSGRTDFLAAMLIPLGLVGVFLLVSGWMVINGLLDMSISSIEQVEGSGHKEKRTSGGKNRSTRYYYVVSGKSFQVSRTAYNALIDNQNYCVYYLPRTKKLVSIEPRDASAGSAQYNFNQ